MATLMELVRAQMDIAHPVGSYYMSENSTNPKVLLGFGEWTQIKDRVLIGAGNSYTVGAQGGSATHTLTVAQMPSHSHDAPQGDTSVDDYVFEVSRTNSLATTGRIQIATSTSTGRYVNGANINATDSIGTNDVNASDATKSTKKTGGGSSFSILNPYRAVYIWRRTA